MNPWQRFCIRGLFGLTGLLLVAQMLFTALASEPFPAVMLPQFRQVSDRDGYVYREIPMLLATKGQQADPISMDSLLADIFPRARFKILRKHLRRQEIPADAELKGWLRDRLQALRPDKAYDGLQIVWYRERAAVSSGKPSWLPESVATYVLNWRADDE